MSRTRIPVRHWRTYGDYPLPTGIEGVSSRPVRRILLREG